MPALISSVHPAASGDRQRIIDDLRELAERADAPQIQVARELCSAPAVRSAGPHVMA